MSKFNKKIGVRATNDPGLQKEGSGVRDGNPIEIQQKNLLLPEIMIMKNLLFVFLMFSGIAISSQTTKQNTQVVEAACGQCQFKMKGKKGCDLAVKIDGKSYFVEGTNIDDHGDAHAKEGFCNTIRKAEVTGRVKGDTFVATSFKLLPSEKK